MSISATDDQHASVTIEQNRCASGKTDCTTSQYLEATNDGVATWTRLS